MKEEINVRINGVKRELWALVRAKATREAKKIPEVINEILQHYFQGAE